MTDPYFDLENAVLTQVGAEYPMTEESYAWKEFVQDKLNSMTNAELLERISQALQKKDEYDRYKPHSF